MTTEEKKTEMLRLLEEHAGNVTKACKALGIHREIYRRWCKADPDFAGSAMMIIGSHKEARKAEAARRPKRTPAAPRETPGDDGLRHNSAAAGAAIRAEHAGVLRSALKERGIYDAGLEPQIRSAASTWAAIARCEEVTDVYSPMQVEISREGNPRITTNGTYEQLRRLQETYTRQMQALGLNFDAKTAPKEDDRLTEFMDRLNRDDDDDR